MSKTTDFLAAIGADRPKRRAEDKRHGGGHEDRLYHGPLQISEAEAALVDSGHVFRTREGKAALSTSSAEGVIYVWRCAPAAGDFLAAIYRTPLGLYRVYVYKSIEMREPWRGEPCTVINRISRFAPDDDAPLMPPLVAPAAPLWMQEETPLEDTDIAQYITPFDLLSEEPS